MELPDFSGPFGGVVAGSFLSGCAAGYAFAKRTVLKLAHSECEALTTRIDEIKAELEEQDQKCEERLKELEKRHEKRIKFLEDRLVTVEDSRVEIALGRGENATD